jgi:hypothetical protein
MTYSNYSNFSAPVSSIATATPLTDNPRHIAAISTQVNKNDIAKTIDRANRLMLGAIVSVVIALIPPTSNEGRIFAAISAVGLMCASNGLVERAKDNPQRRHFESLSKN